jgi:CspA family cold shock protein
MFGTVKFFDPRGFGFIRPSDGGADLYFHVSELPGERGKRFVDVGARVEYELGTRDGKLLARNIVILAGAE